jgi:hypothetical protein
MRRFLCVCTFVYGAALTVNSQVAEMNWELDYRIYLKMANDSSYTYDIREVFHVTDAKNVEFSSEFVFYPVNPGNEYTRELPGNNPGNEKFTTLWNALHARLGGGWIHFTNCIAYALESKTLDLREPIMERPLSGWKPDPVTDSWKRTRKWEYYVPVSQKNAIREYKLRLRSGEPGDLKNLPQTYIDIFLATSDKEYEELVSAGDFNKRAKIDLVKILLGANFLGEPQINYISNAVLSAVKDYSAGKLPSVIVFDEFEAAAAMSLDAEGYQLESIVFKASLGLSEEERLIRQQEIHEIINTINTYNRSAFQKRLKSYYQN